MFCAEQDDLELSSLTCKQRFLGRVVRVSGSDDLSRTLLQSSTVVYPSSTHAALSEAMDPITSLAA